MVIVSIIGCAFYSMKAYVNGDKNGINKTEKQSLVMPFIFFIIIMATAIIFNQVANLNGLAYYYLPAVMGMGIVVTLINYLSEKYNKTLFEVLGVKFSLVGLIVSLLMVIAIVIFAIAIPACLGLSSNFNLFAFNVFKNII